MGVCSVRPFLKGKILVIFLFSPLFSGNAEAADILSGEKLPHQYSIMEWTVDDGLPSDYISDILQTNDGFLWVATERGLTRFDGVSFTNIDRRSHPVLLSNRISCLLEDSNGTLWFGTHGGGIYFFQDESISRITDDEGLPSNYVLALAEDSTGTIWVGTDGEGLGRIISDTIVTYSEGEGLSRHINTLMVDDQNTLWIGTSDGLYLLKNDSISSYHANDRLPAPQVSALYEHDETLWVATNRGLAAFRNGEKITGYLTGKPLDIRSIMKDHRGRFWIGTRERGVYRISATSASNFIHGETARSGDIRVVYPDREGNIWIGTEQGGLIRLRDEVFTTFTVLDGLPDNLTASIAEGNDGEMWIGSAGGLTYLSDKEVRTFRLGYTPSDKDVFSVAVDRDRNVWCVTRTGLLIKLIENRPVDMKLPVPDGIGIWTMFHDSKGALWLGTNNGLYHLYDGNLRRYIAHEDELTNNDVRAIIEDNNGAMWIGTSFGLNKYAEGNFKHFTHETGLSNLIVVSLYADDQGDVWVGTLGGLHRIRDGLPSVITMEHGLPDDIIATILEDDFGYLWIGGGRGISRIDKTDLNDFLDGNLSSVSVKVFGKAHGLKVDRVRAGRQPSGMKAQNGTLWFATDKGVAMVDPSIIRPNPIAPPVQIVSTRVDRTVNTGFRSVSPLELSIDHNEIEISYSAPTFINPSNIIFMYKLEGLGTDWVDAGTRRSAYFSRLPPGDYTFRVIAANEDGIWNEEGASLALVVLPPYWMTWWFRSIVVFLFLSTGPAIYYYRVSRFKKKHAQQQEFLMRLIDSQEAERKRIAADLHDSLGQNIIIIKNRTLLGKKAGSDKEMLSEQLDEIEKTATASLVEMRKISHNLRPFNIERFGLTETIAHTVKDAEASSGIGFRTELDSIDNLLPPAHEIHFFRIVQEALNNILKHSEATSASVSITRKSASLHLTVRDNGRGFDPTKDSPRKGIGLKDIEQRVSLIGGYLTLDSRPGKGTVLTVSVPVPEKSS